MSIDEPLKEPMMVIAVGTYPKTITFDGNKNITGM